MQAGLIVTWGTATVEVMPEPGGATAMSTEAFVFDAVRTPRGKGKQTGSLHEVKPVSLLVGLIDELRTRNPNLDPARIDDVVLGCVTPVGDQGADIAKTAALAAGLPNTVAGVQLNRFCASGLEAVNIAAQKVRSGWDDLILAGGVESMSRVPMGSDGGAWAMDPETAYDTSFVPQGIGADLIASIEGFSREDVDAYALESQARAAKAQSNGFFDRSVVPVRDRNGLAVLERDEFIRPQSTMEGLGELKPSFAMIGEMGGFDAVALQKYHWVERINHVHTPGNSSGIVDGAALVAIGSEQIGKDFGLTPRARIVATAVSGADPTIMLTGPAPACRKALAKAGLTVDDIDLVEMNEAFAAVVLRFMRDMDIPWEKVNVNGGAIALGHPLGATGAMILGTIVDELERRELRYGMVTLCIGGGMGLATIVERV
jgi:acetyl-CoA C-acetyltransferase